MSALITPKLGLVGSEDAPTTAMTLASATNLLGSIDLPVYAVGAVKMRDADASLTRARSCT
jgi:hypothetical protein